MEIKSTAEQLYFTTVRIDTSDQDGNLGSGTGFLFQHTYKEKNYPFIVTNKHVVKNVKKGGFTFIVKDGEEPKLGDSFRLEIDDFDNLWFNHQNDKIDIAVTPLVSIEKYIKESGVDIFYRTIPFKLIPTEEALQGIDALEDIVFIGYPNGIWDSKNCTPIMRKGTTATPISIDFEGEKKFLIDASVFGGSSGSPVFIYNSGSYVTKGGRLKAGTRIHFVGVVASVYYRNELNEIITIPIPTENKPVVIGKEMIDLGIVFKANTVLEAIEQFVDLNTETEQIST
jgi:hypothetical protein